MTRCVGVVAVPGGDRWPGFAAAADRAGVRARCIPWPVVVAGPPPAGVLDGVDLLRVDSPAEDPLLGEHLCGRRRDAGEVLGAGPWVAGVGRAVRRLAGTGLPCTPAPGDLAVLFDKAACSARLAAAGVPVAPALPPVHHWAGLLDAMAGAGWHRVFVKPRFGSSGVGVIALSVWRGRFRAVAHFDVDRAPAGVRLVNRRRPLVLSAEADIAAAVDALAPEGLHVERWVPKLGLDGGPVDIRVVCVAGRATHAAVRRGAGPLTNFQAGARRLDLDEARRALGAAFTAAIDAAERVAAAFPRCLQVGVDVGPLPDRRRVVVFEANAFGDHLLDEVDLHGRRRTTWDAQAAAIAGGWVPAAGPVAA